MRSKRVNILLKAGMYIAIILLALSLILGYIWKVLRSSEYFKVKEIIGRGGEPVNLGYLKGRNIFSLDLKSEAVYILQLYPDSSRIRLVRILPDKIFVDFIKRRAVALVRLYKYFALDKEGVFFSLPSDLQEGSIPVITGLQTRIFGPKAGRKYNSKEILLALELISEVKENLALKERKIRTINLANIADASFTLDDPDGLEIKTGQGKITDKINLLAGILTQGRLNLAQIKYIDLRFREPVIKLKDDKPVK
jgi:cell division septal protein FtsQ